MSDSGLGFLGFKGLRLCVQASGKPRRPGYAEMKSTTADSTGLVQSISIATRVGRSPSGYSVELQTRTWCRTHTMEALFQLLRHR